MYVNGRVCVHMCVCVCVRASLRACLRGRDRYNGATKRNDTAHTDFAKIKLWTQEKHTSGSERYARRTPVYIGRWYRTWTHGVACVHSLRKCRGHACTEGKKERRREQESKTWKLTSYNTKETCQTRGSHPSPFH